MAATEVKLPLPDELQASLAEARKSMEMLTASVPIPLDREAAGEEKIEEDGRPIGSYFKLQKTDNPPVLFTLHSGGFYVGSAAMFDAMFVSYAQAAGYDLFNCEYERCPERTVAELTRNVLQGYEYLTERRGVSPDRVVVYGESAGGGLVALLLNALNGPDTEHPANAGPAAYHTAAKKGKMPRAAMLISPWIDLGMTHESYKTNNNCPVLKGSFDLDPCVWNNTWVPYFVRSRDPAVIAANSAVHINPAGWPESKIVIGSIEPLLDECVVFGKRLKEAGVNSSCDVVQGLTHIGFNPTPDNADLQAIIDKFQVEKTQWLRGLFADDQAKN